MRKETKQKQAGKETHGEKRERNERIKREETKSANKINNNLNKT
jgi:hypothetical protein